MKYLAYLNSNKKDPMVHGSWSGSSKNVVCYDVSGMAAPSSEG